MSQELKDKVARYKNVLAKTEDAKEREIIQGQIDKLEKQLAEPAPAEAKPEKKVIIPKKKETKKPVVVPKKKAVPKVIPKKKEAAKPEPKKKMKVIPKSKKDKPEKKVEKTVKVSKVIPEDEKKTVRNVLEAEHFKVVFKEVAGKKVKVTIRHSDKVVAKNKIASAFNTIGKTVNSEEEKKKYAKDVQTLESMQKVFMDFIERIYKAFNAHDAKQLSALLRKIKSL